MIDAFKRLPDAIQALAGAVLDLVHRVDALLSRWDEMGGVEGRLDALERSRAMWEAEVEALATRAESKFKQARAAEERSRGMEERAQKLTESMGLDEEGEEDIPAEYLDLIRQSDGAPSEEQAMQPVSEGVGYPSTGKDRAKALKWGNV